MKLCECTVHVTHFYLMQYKKFETIWTNKNDKHPNLCCHESVLVTKKRPINTLGSGHWIKYTNPVTLTFYDDITDINNQVWDIVNSPAVPTPAQITLNCRGEGGVGHSITAVSITMSCGNNFICHMTDVLNLLFTNQLFFVALSCLILSYIDKNITG